jgi:ATP phosphoribosyltransferase
MRVRGVLPTGSLHENTLKLFKEAGCALRIKGLKGIPEDQEWAQQIKLQFMRPKGVIYAMRSGLYEFGITGYDWLMEAEHGFGGRLSEPWKAFGHDREEIYFSYSGLYCYILFKFTRSGVGRLARLSFITSPEMARLDILGMKNITYVTEYQKILTTLIRLKRRKGWQIPPKILHFNSKEAEIRIRKGKTIIISDGSNESYIPDLADVAFDIVDTGRTAKENGLCIKEIYPEIPVAFLTRRPFYQLSPVVKKLIGRLTEASERLGGLYERAQGGLK